MIDLEKPSLEELAHYGVKGMHWGHHKPSESIDVSNARKVYNDRENDLQKAKAKSRTRLNLNTQYREAVKDASREFIYSKEDLASAKILDRLKKKPKSNMQLKMEEKYKKQGMSENEAAVSAYKNIRTKKILAGIAGVAVVSLAAYGAYKFHDNRVDKIIKAGTLLQNISDDRTVGIRDAFYATNNKFDNVKYKGLFGMAIADHDTKAIKKEIKVLSDIRQASPNNAHKILSDLIESDDSFRESLKTYFSGEHVLPSIYSDKIKVARRSLSQGKVDKNVYEVFNASLVDHSERMQPLTDKYFSVLSKKGYNALKDVNDSKHSGFKAINPILAFNTSGKVNVINVTELADKEIKKCLKIGLAHMYVPKLVGTYAAVTSPLIASKLIKKEVDARKAERQKNNTIQKYRNEHPNSILTNTEIIRMVERGQTET